MRFETKKDWMGKLLLFVPTLLITILSLISLLKLNLRMELPPSRILLSASILFWTWLLLAWQFTYYTLDKTHFSASFALFFRARVKLEDIEEIKTQTFGRRIYGLSKDVLAIKMKNGRQLNISPLRRVELKAEILKRKTGLSGLDK